MTGELALIALLVSLAIGIPAGVIAAVKNGTAIDYGTTMAALWGLSIPNFWLGMLLILLFSVELGLLPASGFVSPGESLSAELVDPDHARFRARQCFRRRHDAAHPQRDAAGARRRLRPHRARQGARRERVSSCVTRCATR